MKKIIKKIIPKRIKDLYTIIYYKMFVNKHRNILVLDFKQTVDKIIKEKKSISRFGEGEFRWLMGLNMENSFQQTSKELMNKLNEVIECNNDNLLICIPESFKSIDEYTKNSKRFWSTFIRTYGKDCIKYIQKNKEYGNANFTRWYIEYEDKEQTKKRLEEIKKIWDKKELVIIEGRNTRMGIGNDLFDNAKSIQRIIAPSKNAFEKYEEIFNSAKIVDKNKLILIALGPTATVLAADLAKEGYQAIDIGHIDIEYEWYLRNVQNKVKIEGKDVLESGGLREEEECKDEKYVNSIIKYIGEKNENS